MTGTNLSFISVYFRYPDTPDPVFTDLSLEIPRGWTGITGENGAGKTTLLELAAGLLEGERGTVRRLPDSWLCRQRTDDPPSGFEDFLYSGDSEAMRLMSLLGIDWDWPSRWSCLSHGERKRAQIAVALYLQPGLLALDEPTNHLDTGTKDILIRALKAFPGTGLIVSHDREVLDTLCSRCVFIRNGNAVLRPGGVSTGLREEERERLEAGRAHREALHDYSRIRREAEARRHIAEGSRNRVSKRNLKPGDSDARGKINLAIVSGKDAVGGKLYSQFESRLKAAGERVERTTTAAVRKTGVRLHAGQSKSDTLFRSDSGVIPLGPGRTLALPPLTIRPTDRIALTGANGSGKTTLIRFITGRTGTEDRVLYIPQEIEAAQGGRILGRLRDADPAFRGEVLSRFSRLGSDPARLLVSGNPSPGETRKLLFALGVFTSPSLIIMDEPTNHLDLPSIGLLEEMLREIPCALLLVSHDREFLRALTDIEWKIREENKAACTLVIDGDAGAE